MSDTRYIDLCRAVARELKHDIVPESVILDFGCGRGQIVRQLREAGFNAYGTDIILDEQTEFLRLIEPNKSYRIPFDDNTFDAIFSNSVLEHVKDLPEAASEMRRVLKPGGFCLHFFPSKLKPIEPHLFVPFGGAIRNYSWLAFWSFLGIRNSFGKHKPWRQNAIGNYYFLRDKTAYASKKHLRDCVSMHFDKVTFAEKYHIKHSYGRVRSIYSLVRAFPGIALLYSSFHMRVLFLEKEKFAFLESKSPSVCGSALQT